MLVLVCAAAYAPTLHNGWVLDDQYMIADNAAIRDLAAVPRFFVTTPPGAINRDYYRPVMLTSFAIDYALFRGSPAALHAMNVLYHAAVAFIVLLLLERLLGASASSASKLGALVFALHPVQSEVVYLVNYRATTLAAGFFFAALYYYVKHRAEVLRPAQLALLALLYFCSVASKEIGITLPFAMLLYDRLLAPAARLRLAPYVACGLVIALYAVLRHLLCTPSSNSYFGASPALDVALTMLVVEAFAVLVLFVPLNLAATYDSSYLPVPSGLFDPWLWLALVVLGLVSWAAFRARQRAPLVTFAILFHFLALGPTYHIIRLPILFGERFLYLPMFGFCLLIAAGMARLTREPTRLARFAWAAAIALCILFGLRDHARAYDWRSPETLWRATVAARPRSLQAHIGLATTLRAVGKCQQALPHYEFALRAVDPALLASRPVYGDAASCYSFAHDWPRTRAVIERWLRAHPNDTGFQQMLRHVQAVEGRGRARQ